MRIKMLALAVLTAWVCLGGVPREAGAAGKNPAGRPPALDVLPRGANKLLHKYLMTEVRRLDATRVAAVERSLRSPEALAARQKELRRNYRKLLGELPEKTPLRAQVTGTIECDGYRVEKVMYESRPRHRVTANLYVPTGTKGPCPGVLVACGHSGNGKAKDLYQLASAAMARNGLVALCYDPICQGERLQLLRARRHGTTTHTLLNLGALLVGRSVVGYEAWDGIRGIDYLLSRPEVDHTKPVGMTGTSGGGTQTTFLMALDERIGPAAPSCYVMTRLRKFETLGPADGCQHLPGEGKLGIDHADYITVRAPKPTIVLAARHDFFDIKATRQAGAEARRVYRVLAHPDSFQLFESDDEHGLHPPHRNAAVCWMRRWLLESDEPISETGIKPYADQMVQATASGQVVREFKDERTVADLNLERAKQLADARRRFWSEHDRNECLAEVKRLIGFREKRSEAVARPVGSVEAQRCRIEKLVIQRPAEVPVPAVVFVPETVTGKLPATLYVDGRGKQKDAAADGPILDVVRRGRIVMSIDVRGFGETADRGSGRKYRNVEHRVAVLAHYLGRPLLGQRVEDVIAALDILAKRDDVDPRRIDVVGVERGGPVALHAAALDGRLAAVTIRRSIRSWVDDVVAKAAQRDLIGHVVPRALLKYDLPDLAAVIAPRPVRGMEPADAPE